MSASASALDTPGIADAAAPLLRRRSGKALAGLPPTDSADATIVGTTPPGRPRRRVVMILLLLAALVGAGTYAWHWWTTGRFEEVTDDAFLQADKVVVAPKVGGFVSDVFVTDNQPVKAGDVIARIDDRDYQVTLLQNEADLEKSKASLEGVGSALIQQQARIVEAKADVANTRAALAFSRQEQTRYADLMARGAGTIQRSQQTSSDLLMKQAALDKAEANADAAEKQIDGLRSLEAAARASLRRAEINLQQAKLNIGYTTIKAPIAGVVGDRSLRKGQLVQPGTNLLTVVPMGEAIYLVANFKETQVGQMVPGQAARFRVDAFGGHIFEGRIDSFAPGTGSQFALLPPENATGNFTKIVQRVPVKIALAAGDPMIAKLRPGLSAEAIVDVRDTGATHPSDIKQISAR